MFADIPIDETDRSFWSESKGLEYINKLAFESDVQPIRVAIEGKYYAVSALAAVGMKLRCQDSFSNMVRPCRK